MTDSNLNQFHVEHSLSADTAVEVIAALDRTESRGSAIFRWVKHSFNRQAGVLSVDGEVISHDAAGDSALGEQAVQDMVDFVHEIHKVA